MILGAMLLLVLVTSCREESDALQNYVFNDGLAFDNAQKSFAGKFKVLWKALDQNYGIWDYERSQGVDWDAVYDEYLPKYEALDKRDDVTDDELQKLLEATLAPLHDGHFGAQMENHQTGGSVLVVPSNTRDKERDDYEAMLNTTHDLRAYLPAAYGGTGNQILEYKEASTQTVGILKAAYTTPGIGRLWAKAHVNDPALEDYQQQALQDFIDDFDNLFTQLLNGLDLTTGIQMYDQLVAAYKYLHIPGLIPSNTFGNYALTAKYACFKDNIAYFYLSDFYLTPYMNDENFHKKFGQVDAVTQQLGLTVRQAWQAWFDKVQQLHASGQLKGVIIDLRNNGGGMLTDYQYVLGSMLPSGDFEVAFSRFKRGVGRYDYSPLSPFKVPTLETTHETITEPIVILTNSGSVSMAEMTSLGCQSLPNGTLIGKRTHGGLCSLIPDPGVYYQNYSGIIGERGVTPVWLYIPQMTTVSKEGQILEGVGLTPDIEVDLDVTQYQATGRDTQLERALQFCTTGN